MPQARERVEEEEDVTRKLPGAEGAVQKKINEYNKKLKYLQNVDTYTVQLKILCGEIIINTFIKYWKYKG